MMKRDSIRKQLEALLQVLTSKVSDIDHTLRELDSADWQEGSVENKDEEVLEDMGDGALEEIVEIHVAFQRSDMGTFCTYTSFGDLIDEH